MKQAPFYSRFRFMPAAFILGAMAGLAVVYGMGGFQRNAPVETACRPAADLAKKLEPLFRGEIAALTPAKTPIRVSSLSFRDADGRDRTLADWNGRVVLLNLWATWCGFCRQEMPLLVKMQGEHRDEGFEVLGLNVDDESIDEVNSFAQEMKLNYSLVWSNAKTTNELLRISKFQGIPQSFLVDREGNLRGVFTGANPANLRKMEDLVASVVSE